MNGTMKSVCAITLAAGLVLAPGLVKKVNAEEPGSRMAEISQIDYSKAKSIREMNPENLLSCSASDYVASRGKELNQYHLISVIYCNDPNSQDTYTRRKIPTFTEVITDINEVSNCLVGTALVPK
jgi:hypothetical protein